MSDWFITPEEAQQQAKKEQQTQKSGNKVPQFFDISEKGDSREVTFLDPNPSDEFKAPPILRVHSTVFEYREGQKYPSKVLCPRGKGEPCPICDYRDTLDKDSREYATLKADNYFCYSVLSVNTDDEGEPLPAIKQIRLTNAKQTQNLLERNTKVADTSKGPMKDLEGLSGNTFEVSRPDEDFIPRIGVIGDFLETPELEDLHADAKPFTPEELIERFESDVEEMQAFVDRKTSGNGDFKPKVNRS